MRFIYAEYNMYHNSVDVTTFDDILRIDCKVAENGLRTTPCSQCALDALAIDVTANQVVFMIIFCQNPLCH